MNWDVKLGGFHTVARVTSLAAADAVERLYGAAWDRGERPRFGMETVEVEDHWHFIPLHTPMTDPEVEHWFARVAGRRGCAYCRSDKHASDRCPNVLQAEERHVY
tara:strand:+ start:172 stop:486 length:315 start_codon:yes stop_codon:yes gene_type:complete